MEQQIALILSWLLVVGVCSLVAYCYGSMHSPKSQLPPAHSPTKESGSQQGKAQEGKEEALPASTNRPCSAPKCVAREAELQGRYNDLYDEAAAKVDKLSKRIDNLTNQVSEQASKVTALRKTDTDRLRRVMYLEREHAKYPGGGGISKADHEKAMTAKELECDEYCRQIAELQATLASKEQEHQRSLGMAVEQARLETIQIAEELHAAAMAGCQDPRVPPSPEDAIMEDCQSSFDLNIEAPMPMEAPLADVDEAMDDIEQTTTIVVPAPYQPPAETEASLQTAHGEAVLAQALPLQTAERNSVADAEANPNIDPILLAHDRVAHRVVEHTPVLDVRSQVAAMVAEERGSQSAQPVGDHARAMEPTRGVLFAQSQPAQTPSPTNQAEGMTADSQPAQSETGGLSPSSVEISRAELRGLKHDLEQLEGALSAQAKGIRALRKSVKQTEMRGQSAHLLAEQQDKLELAEDTHQRGCKQREHLQTQIEELESTLGRPRPNYRASSSSTLW